MDEHEIALVNSCTDLVTLRQNEIFARRLLESKGPGEWVPVGDFCSQVGIASQAWKRALFAAWLPDPMENEGYVVIVFYDDESKWSMAAHYNRHRVARQADATIALPGTALPAPIATSTGQQTAR